jgi:hypothetical protein
MAIALPHEHLLARRESADEALPLQALAGEAFIAYRRHIGPGLYDAILAACNKAGFSPRIGQKAPQRGVPSVSGPAQPKAPLHLVSRRGETSAAIRKFLSVDPEGSHQEATSASATARLRDGGPILCNGMEAMSRIGSPPPRIEIGAPLKSSRAGRRNHHLSFSHPGRLMPPDARRHLVGSPRLLSCARAR